MALSSSTSPLPSSDLLTSLAFSPLSTHMALTSLDHTLRILHPSPAPAHPQSNGATEGGGWTHSPREWKAHDGPVLCCAWAAAEFGTVLASGGVDGAVKVWREDVPPPSSSSFPTSSSSAPAGRGTSGGGMTGQGWSLIATLTDAHGTIRSLSFAPAEFGLKLAAVASDSHLRVWDCLDPLSLRDWALIHDVDLLSLPLGSASATSTAGAGGSGVQGLSAADGSAVGSSAASSSVDGRSVGQGRGGTVESDGAWAVDWCKEGWWGERLAVSAGTNGIVRLFHFPAPTSELHTTLGSWAQFLTLLPPPSFSSSSRGFTSATSGSSHSSHPYATSGHGDDPPPSALHTPPTNSLSWAPPSGRSFQLLACGSRDGKARVWKLHPPSLASSAPGEPAASPEEGDWTAKLDVELDAAAGAGDGRGQAGRHAPPDGALGACRVEWNVTGTVLSTTGGGAEGEGGKVRLWKPTYTGQWRLIASLGTEDAPQTPAAGFSDAEDGIVAGGGRGRIGSPLAGGGALGGYTLGEGPE
ncbi:hypothetical protein JCM10213_003487 [Rhodosporidiobolus nylandii]